MSKLSEKLKNLRMYKDVLPSRVAWEIGVGRSMILRYESGDKIPPDDKLELLAKYFGVDVEYLLNDEIDIRSE